MFNIKQKIDNLKNNQALKDKLYAIIFGTETPAGKRFDVILMTVICVSVFLIVCDSFVVQYVEDYPWMHTTLYILELALQIFFIAEYITRIYCHPKPKEYIMSFFGVVDLLSIIPFGYNAALRSLRIIRVFRVFKMLNFLEEGHELLVALQRSMNKILVFFLFVLILNICMGSILWTVEHNVNENLKNVLDGVYCSIVTMTTVGYGDLTPVTGLGKLINSIMMLVGYTIVAIPTGIVSAEIAKSSGAKKKKMICPICGKTKHRENAKHCDFCGATLEEHVVTKTPKTNN